MIRSNCQKLCYGKTKDDENGWQGEDIWEKRSACKDFVGKSELKWTVLSGSRPRWVYNITRQTMYVQTILMRFCVTVIAVEKQELLHITSVST